MVLRRDDGLVLAAGILFLASPLYWEVVEGTPLAMLDPFGALGLTPGGGFLVIVGATYVTVAAVVTWIVRVETPPFETLVVGGLLALGIAWFATWRAFSPEAPALEVATELVTRLVVATAPIALAAAAGVARDRRRQLLVVAVALVAIGQFLVLLLPGGGPFRPRTLGGVVTILLALVIPVFDVAFAYPLYRYGWQLDRDR